MKENLGRGGRDVSPPGKLLPEQDMNGMLIRRQWTIKAIRFSKKEDAAYFDKNVISKIEKVQDRLTNK